MDESHAKDVEPCLERDIIYYLKCYYYYYYAWKHGGTQMNQNKAANLRSIAETVRKHNFI